MICHEFKCIFVHQRKCAGTSIMRAFGTEPDTPEWHFMNDGVLSPEHRTRPGSYFVFSVVRNPWDRFISGWKYCKSTRMRPLRDVLENLPRDGHDYRHLTRPQHAILFDAGAVLGVDCVMRYESLQEDFDRVCAIIGKPHAKLPELNVGKRDHYTSYFDDATRELFSRKFERDIELFGYRY